MDVKYGKQPVPLSQDVFHKLDYQVMGLAFDLHNEFGNLWDEKEYQCELVVRCRSAGLDTFEEVPVSISRNGFSKTYFIDLLINGSIYELKTASMIAGSHETQTLNYLLMANTQHGKLINFRQDSLTWRFVSTKLRNELRMDYSTAAEGWHPTDEKAQSTLEIMHGLLASWGTYLSVNLYKEALRYFLGIPLENEQERFVSISSKTVLHVSGLSSHKNNLQHNLQKYLNRSRYNELLWINFNQNKIEFSSLNNSAYK
jgi:GxxExxY protein